MKPRTQSRQAGRAGQARSTGATRSSSPSPRANRKASAAFTNIKEILVPTDFSEYSEIALDYALSLAKQFEAKITLLYVIEPTTFTDFQNTPLSVNDTMARRQAAGKLEVVREQHDRDKAFIRETKVVIGKPFDQITSLARGMRQDLIVIATHGRTGLKHVLIGSTAEKVVRHATCPVLVVRPTKS